MFKEFKEFISKGNAMDLAVGVILGAAFGAIVNSLVNDLIMPIIGVVTGGTDFSQWFIALDGNKYANLAQAQDAGAALLKYGNFINAIINFIIIGFVIFLIVKGLNKMRRAKEEVEEEVTTKVCPACSMEIPLGALKCPYCLTDQK